MENRRIREAPAKYKAGLFLGLTMVVCALFMLITRFTALEIDGVLISVDDGPLGIVSKFLMLAGGLIILIKRKKGNYFAIGIYALTLGIARLIRALPNLTAESDIIFYSSLFIIALSANLAATGYNHLTVRMKNPINMRYTTMVILGCYAIVLLYFVYIGEKPTVILNFLPDVMWYIPIYASLLVVLFSKDVLYNSPMGRINTFSAETADRFGLGDDITVSEEDAEKIKAGLSGPQGWKTKNLGDIIVSEENITFESCKGTKDVILERCEGDANLRITIIDDRNDSFINGYRMMTSSYIESYGSLELMDDRGICVKLHVRRSQRWIWRTPGYIPTISWPS